MWLNPGTRVKKEMGVRLSGMVIEYFYWKDSTDGTYKEPSPAHVPVQWDDGTKGWISMYHLIKE